MAAKSVGQAAETLAYYIGLALERSGVKMTPDMRTELSDAVEAFKGLDADMGRVHQAVPSSAPRPAR